MEVTVADSMTSQSLGYVGRKSISPDEALVFPFRSIGPRLIHMIGVRCDLGVIWAIDGIVMHAEVLPAWRGVAMHDADLVVECHPERARRLDEGDDLPEVVQA